LREVLRTSRNQDRHARFARVPSFVVVELALLRLQ
jgi:hypothetical protein